MNILFRLNSSSKIGIGHLMRSLTLAKEFKKLGTNITFACENLEGNLNEKVIENGFELETIQSNSPKLLKSVIKKYSIDIVVFDSYDIGYNYEKDISELVKIVSFDDTYENHFSDFIINQNIHSEKSKYKELVPKKTKVISGLKYALIRDEFKTTSIPKKREGILVTLGGSDEKNETLKILKRLDENLKVTVVIGKSNPNIESIKNYIKNKNFKLIINADNMHSLMAEHKIALTAGGSTTIEALYMQMPLILKSIASNQDEIVSTIIKEKVGVKIKKDINSQIKEIEKNYKSYQKRISKLKISTKNTAFKILTSLIKTKNFTKLTLKESMEVLKYINHNNSEIISLKEHLKSIDKLKKTKSQKHLLIKMIDINIGVINFDYISKTEANFIIYPNPKLENVYLFLINELLKDIKKNEITTLKTKILDKKVIKIYEKNGFECKDGELIFNK